MGRLGKYCMVYSAGKDSIEPHQFTTPVEWEHKLKQGNGAILSPLPGQENEKLNYTEVTRLRCACGAEEDR